MPWNDMSFEEYPATQVDHDHEADLMSQNLKVLKAWNAGDFKFLTNPQFQTLSNESWFRTFCFRWMDWYERED